MSSTAPLAMSAVIPAVNEAGRIHQTVSPVWKYVSEVIEEISAFYAKY